MDQTRVPSARSRVPEARRAGRAHGELALALVPKIGYMKEDSRREEQTWRTQTLAGRVVENAV